MSSPDTVFPAVAEEQVALREDTTHMERCLAIQRRGQLERVMSKLKDYDDWKFAIDVGKSVGRHNPDDPPLNERQQREYDILVKMRDEIVAEMEAVGQT